jgi:hypothetical protein
MKFLVILGLTIITIVYSVWGQTDVPAPSYSYASLCQNILWSEGPVEMTALGMTVELGLCNNGLVIWRPYVNK